MHRQSYPISKRQHPDGSVTRRAWLPIRLVNPEEDAAVRVFALLDTGADSCLIPGDITELLSHDLKGDGVESAVTAGIGGYTVATYKHTFLLQLLSLKTGSVVWSSPPTLVECTEACAEECPPLLGVSDFLRHFTVTVDYPRNAVRLCWQ